jgi:hypothetical protein
MLLGAFDGDGDGRVGTIVPTLPSHLPSHLPCLPYVSVLRLAYASLSPRRRSRRYLFLYHGHLPAPPDSLRRTGAGGLAHCGGRGPRETSVYNRCLGLIAGSPSFDCMDAGGRAMQEQLPSLWTLPPGDANYSLRWGLIKRSVSMACAGPYYRADWMTDSKIKHRESTFWQRRYWEHSRRNRFCPPRRLHLYQSGQTRPGRANGRLAIFDFSSGCEKGPVSVELGHRT